MTRFVDRGAITAAWVGVGMAVTIAVSFLLIIPIEFLYTAISPLFAGLLIGYYANSRSERAGGPWGRILGNALLAGLATGLSFAILLLGVKALFFSVDAGYRDASAGGSLTCQSGAGCVYERHRAFYGDRALADAGVTDVASFTSFYWREQGATAVTMIVLSTGAAIAGGLVYGVTNRRRPQVEGAAPARPA